MAHRNLAGSRSLLTGASSGIGREMALQLAAAGGHVMAVARREEKLRELPAAAQSAGSPGSIQWFAGDVTDPDVRSRAVHLAVDRFGGLDALINNAGIGSFGRFEDADPARLRQIFEVNFFSVVELTRLALPELRQGNRPLVVNVGSILGYRGIPRMHEYCSTKFALRGLSESLRIELKPHGIDLLLVSPHAQEMHGSARHLRGEAARLSLCQHSCSGMGDRHLYRTNEPRIRKKFGSQQPRGVQTTDFACKFGCKRTPPI